MTSRQPTRRERNRQALVEQYKIATSEREKSDIEEKLWNGASVREKKAAAREFTSNIRANWICTTVGAMMTECRAHSAVRSLGEAGDRIWDSLDAGVLSCHAAMIAAREAKKLSAEGISLEQAVARVLGVDDRPVSKKQGRCRSVKQIWGDIKRDLQQLFDQKLEASGVDPMFVGQFRSDFETDLKVFFTEQTERLYRFKRNMSTPVPKVTALHLEDACDTLFIDPPDETKPVPDAYRKKARRQMRLLAKEHHVDRNPGCEVEARERYDEVMRAYETLSNYLDDLDRKHEKRFQVINGGMA